MRRAIAFAVAAVVALLAVAACTSDSKSSAPARQEAKSRDGSYSQQVAGQPAHTMGYSPTRDTINFWIDTWKQRNKLSYVVLLASNGQKIGYYILKGLPVSYCAAQTPTWTYEGTPDDDSKVRDQRVPAPSVDGVYYSGGQCDVYYGKDAVNGMYVEYSTGAGINALVYDQPVGLDKVEPLGVATVDAVK